MLSAIMIIVKNYKFIIMEASKPVKRHMAEDLLARFRSKEDLYRYMTQQGKSPMVFYT
jgi:hypothetical protein